ncbi:hypothetical protein ACWDBO_33735 [Streptomyces mirabilis]|uniref:hypothetical protein n=1 Tax=Streptomyces mirabilis TaxID=68239 RepID=UPI00331C650E
MVANLSSERIMRPAFFATSVPLPMAIPMSAALMAGARRGFHHRLQGVHRALGLALLAQAHDRVQQGQDDQQDRGGPLLDEQ